MDRAASGVNQAIEVIQEYCAPEGSLVIDAEFDEFNLDIRITYQGAALELPDHRPSDKDIIERRAVRASSHGCERDALQVSPFARALDRGSITHRLLVDQHPAFFQ